MTVTGRPIVRLSPAVVEAVKLRMTFAEDQGEPVDIEKWLKEITELQDQGDYWLMVLREVA